MTGADKERLSWLKQTLGTKDEKQAKVLAIPVMMKFDGAGHQTDAIDPKRSMHSIDGSAIPFQRSYPGASMPPTFWGEDVARFCGAITVCGPNEGRSTSMEPVRSRHRLPKPPSSTMK